MRFTRFMSAFVFLLGTFGLTNPLFSAETPGISVYISIAPAPSTPDACLCSAEITDLSNGQVVAAPKITIKKGEVGKVSVGDHANYDLVLDITIDKTGSSATYAVTYSKKDKIVSVQKGAISIR